MSPGSLHRLPMVQILFFTWLKALSIALVFKGIQIFLANQMSKKVVTFRERFSMYALARGYLSSGRASISSLKPCSVFSASSFTLRKSLGVSCSKSTWLRFIAGIDLSLSVSGCCWAFFRYMENLFYRALDISDDASQRQAGSPLSQGYHQRKAPPGWNNSTCDSDRGVSFPRTCRSTSLALTTFVYFL